MQLYQDVRSILARSRNPGRTLFRFLFSSAQELVLPRPLPDPAELQGHPDLIWQRYDAMVILRQMPYFKTHDTPTASVYRMCEFICADEPNQLMLEVTYFWERPSWQLEAIPDPYENNKVFAALFAATIESLVDAFNWRQSLGLRRDEAEHEIREEKCPLWTNSILPLDYPLNLRKEELPFPRLTSSPFSKRNIDANAGNIFHL